MSAFIAGHIFFSTLLLTKPRSLIPFSSSLVLHISFLVLVTFLNCQHKYLTFAQWVCNLILLCPTQTPKGSLSSCPVLAWPVHQPPPWLFTRMLDLRCSCMWQALTDGALSPTQLLDYFLILPMYLSHCTAPTVHEMVYLSTKKPMFNIVSVVSLDLLYVWMCFCLHVCQCAMCSQEL